MKPAHLSLAIALLASACGSPRPSTLDASPTLDASSTLDVRVEANDTVDAAEPDANEVGTGCAEYSLTDMGGALSSPALNETSGLVASRIHPGVFYVHNDSGDSARFFAINLAGAVLGEYRLDRATAVDWEDITRSPCGASTCVVIGDIGDNDRRRASVTLYRVEEPALTMSPSPVSVPWTALTFRYPDGAHNAETLVADPTSGEVYVITKVEQGRVTAYRAPREDGGVAERVAEMEIPAGAGQVTGGDVRADGRAMLLRTYARVLFYEGRAGAPFADLFSATPRPVASRVEPQGEAVGWTLDGDGYATVSEGTSVRINVFRCASP